MSYRHLTDDQRTTLGVWRFMIDVVATLIACTIAYNVGHSDGVKEAQAAAPKPTVVISEPRFVEPEDVPYGPVRPFSGLEGDVDADTNACYTRYDLAACARIPR